jgi:hypothetical protein
MHRFILTNLGLCTALLLTGCPGTLSDPDAYRDAGTEIKDAETILAESCGTADCHDDTNPPEFLDLLSPNVEDRVVDVNANGAGCTNKVLVVPGDPDLSYLLNKVENVPGICGLAMPIVGNLAVEEVEVLRQWVIDLGDASGGAPDGG